MAQQRGAAGGPAGRGWAIAGIVSGVLTLVLSPIIFGVLGVILGYVGRRKGAGRLGTAAIVIPIALFVLAIVLRLILVSVNSPA